VKGEGMGGGGGQQDGSVQLERDDVSRSERESELDDGEEGKE